MRHLISLILMLMAILGTGVNAQACDDEKLVFAADNVDASREKFLEFDQLVKQNVEQNVVKPENIRISEIDLNNDGASEVLVYIDDPFYCGAQGCNFQGFTVKENKLVELIPQMIVPQDMSFAGTGHNGYRDINITNSKGDVFVWAYDDSKHLYSPVNAEASEQKIIAPE